MSEFINAGALCTPSKLPASDYVINPYSGCTHRCEYCYASFMSRFNGHAGEKWGSYIEPKHYKTMKLPRDLKGKTILVGSVTDAYNPAEKKYELMPEILEILSTCEAHVEILTKSDLILRDLKILKKIPDLAVGISLSNLNNIDNKATEPGASSAEERINTLRVLHEAGIRTYIFVAPYLPGITKLEEIISEVGNFVDYICVENLNLRSNKEAFLNLVDRLHPEVSGLFQDVYVNAKGNEYWKSVEGEIELLKSTTGKDIVSYMYHEKIKKGAK